MLSDTYSKNFLTKPYETDHFLATIGILSEVSDEEEPGVCLMVTIISINGDLIKATILDKNVSHLQMEFNSDFDLHVNYSLCLSMFTFVC